MDIVDTTVSTHGRHFKMRKKIISILAIVSMFNLSMVGCSNKSSAVEQEMDMIKDTIEEQTTVETTNGTSDSNSKLDMDVSELMNTLTSTCWVGCDSNRNLFAIYYNGNSVSINCSYATGDAVILQGYWNINNDILYIYSDREMTNELTNFDFEYINVSEDTSIIKLNDACLSQTSKNDGTDLHEPISNMKSIVDNITYLCNGTYWVGLNDDQTLASLLYIDGSVIDFYEFDIENDDETTMECSWGLDYNKFYVVDSKSKNYMQFDWSMTDDGSSLCLTNEDGETINFEQSDAYTFNDAFDLISEYVIEETTTEETTTTEPVTETEVTWEFTTAPNNYFDTPDGTTDNYFAEVIPSGGINSEKPFEDGTDYYNPDDYQVDYGYNHSNSYNSYGYYGTQTTTTDSYSYNNYGYGYDSNSSYGDNSYNSYGYDSNSSYGDNSYNSYNNYGYGY